MDIGSTLTLILGTGFVASLITLLGQYYLDRRGKEEDVQIEQNEKIIGEVYSPLLFHLFGIRDYLGAISVSLKQFQYYEENAIEKSGGHGSKVDEDWLIACLKKDCGLFCSDSIQEILKTRIGFIKPLSFRREFFCYFQAISAFEKEITSFSKAGFAKEDDVEKQSKQVIWLEDMIDVVRFLEGVTVEFDQYIDDSIEKKNNQMSISEYKGILPEEDFKKNLLKIGDHINFGY